jgi:glycerol uptake facilitator-like aquaporin/catechol 2,3-dioxygenase-like lactoylglutathione lyase family enzyme
MLAALKKNWKLYLMEALGLAIFMVSACFFGAMFFSQKSSWYHLIPNDMTRNVLMGLMMGLTALFIFYSPFTAPSGAHINPAVTITFLRLKKMKREDAFFYIPFQFIGGTMAVFIMQLLMGKILTDAPVNSVVTIPGKAGAINAAITEFIIAFIMITMILFTSANNLLKKYTKIFAAFLVCIFVIVAGPISGFGMNPARSFASGFPANIYTAFWIYMLIPFAGMLTAAEFFLGVQSIKRKCKLKVVHKNIHLKKQSMKKHFKVLLINVLFLYCGNNVLAQIKKVDAIGITVKEMSRAVRFYEDVLGFKKIADNEYSGTAYEKLNGVFGLNIRVVRMQLGDEYIELTDYLTAGGRTIPEDQQSNDLFFQHIAIVVSDMDKAFAQLKKNNVEFVSTAPQTLPVTNVAAAGIKAFYFHDIDNHNLEIIYFPKGKGNPKWQSANNKIFLGIDHTAIGVSSTANSQKFYQDVLGIERKGDSWNFGTEQEHLNNVEGASLHITGYRATAGPGIEFLEYLKPGPGPGKKYPADTRADDIWFWQTTLFTDDAEALYNKLKTLGHTIISKELVNEHSNGNHTKSFIVKDPDGHAMLVKEMVK